MHLSLNVGSTNSDAFPCGICGMMIWSGQFHSCGGTVTLPSTTRLASAWNGPVCHVCGQGHLGNHDCPMVTVPCPDGRLGCAVAHYAHRPPAEPSDDRVSIEDLQKWVREMPLAVLALMGDDPDIEQAREHIRLGYAQALAVLKKRSTP